MIELKIQCDCGQKYKFDVEPANGQMSFAVACPICGVDGTAKANAWLQQMSVFKLVEPPAVANAPAAAAVAPPPIGGLPRRAPAPAAAAVEPGKEPSFAKGLLGALIGALVGAVVYFAIFKITGPFFMLRYVLAIGVGALTGWLANLLGKSEGSKELGGLAAVFTVVGILAAQYFLTLDKWDSSEEVNSINQAIEDGGYAQSVKQSKEVVKVISTGSEAEIRMYLAKEQAEDGQPPKPEKISGDEVKQFRDHELTNYFDLASGTLTKEAFWAKNGFDPKAAKKFLDTEDKAVTGLAVVIAIFKAGIISMIVGAGTAFKLSANA